MDIGFQYSPGAQFSGTAFLQLLVPGSHHCPLGQFRGCAEPVADIKHPEWTATLYDLLTAYAAVDIPESEAILFDPPFSRMLELIAGALMAPSMP